MRRIMIVLGLFVLACGPSVAVDSGDGTSSEAADDESPAPRTDPDDDTSITSADTTAATTVDPTTATISTSEGTSLDPSTSGAEESGGFIHYGDGGGTSTECDIWIDDCPPNEKCMPWANDGGSSWNATRCSPLAGAPNQVGEPCTVEGSGVSGIDDCEAHAMCWDVDPETNVGTCVAFCSGSPANPTCGDPCTPCTIANEGMLILCLAMCDPLVQDCREGQACFPFGDSFVCSPCCAGESGAMGDGCYFWNDCDPGLFCAAPERFPGCQNETGCCTPLCDALADAPCPLDGTECIPWFDEGEVPPCFSQVIGGCLLPE